MKTIQIPDEGLKLIVVAGTFSGNALWRTVGKLLVGKNGKPVVQLDKTFNPAGVHTDPNSATILCSCVEYSEEEQKKKQYYKNEQQPQKKKTNITNEYFGNDIDDDIPF